MAAMMQEGIAAVATPEGTAVVTTVIATAEIVVMEETKRSYAVSLISTIIIDLLRTKV
jgi:hypothetical protein